MRRLSWSRKMMLVRYIIKAYTLVGWIRVRNGVIRTMLVVALGVGWINGLCEMVLGVNPCRYVWDSVYDVKVLCVRAWRKGVWRIRRRAGKGDEG